MANVTIEIDEKKVKELVVDYLQSICGDGISIAAEDVKIQVKSKQNYKSEWETANFKAIFSKTL